MVSLERCVSSSTMSLNDFHPETQPKNNVLQYILVSIHSINVGPYHQKQYNSLVKRMKSEIRSKDPFQDFVSIINGGII